MKKRKILFFIIIILTICSIPTTYSRYIISKNKELTITTSADKNSGTVNFEITNKKNIYTVTDKNEKTTISSEIVLENKDSINIKAYYKWTTDLKEPEFNEENEFSFSDNKYTVQKEQTRIGVYYLWVKVTYSSEIGEEKTVIKNSNAINVVLGDIEIKLEDEESEYLSGNVVVNITYKGNYTHNAKVRIWKNRR